MNQGLEADRTLQADGLGRMCETGRRPKGDRMGSRLRILGTVCAVGILAACSASEEPTWTIHLELPERRSVVARIGETGSLPVNLLDMDSDDDVEVSFEGLPAGTSGVPLHLSRLAPDGRLVLRAGAQATPGGTPVEVVARVRGRIGFRASVLAVVHSWGEPASAVGTDGVVSIPPYPYNLYPVFAPEWFEGAWSPREDRGWLISSGTLIPVWADETVADSIPVTSRGGGTFEVKAGWTESRLFLAGVIRDCMSNCIVILCLDIEGAVDPTWGNEGEVRLEGSSDSKLEDLRVSDRGVSVLSSSGGVFSVASLGMSGTPEHEASGAVETYMVHRAYLRKNGFVVLSTQRDIQDGASVYVSKIALFDSDVNPIQLSTGRTSVDLSGVSVVSSVDATDAGFFTCGIDHTTRHGAQPVVQRWKEDGTPDSAFARPHDGKALLFHDPDRRRGYCEKLVVREDRLVALVRGEDYGYSLVVLKPSGEPEPAVGFSGEIGFNSAHGHPALSLGLRGEAVFAYSSGSYGIRVHKLY